MCGIAGIAGGRQGPKTREVLRHMLAAIAHRGPDGAGLYQDDGAAIGSRRLSIIDLATGDQPITNETKSVWLVFNGEIYNYRDLRAQLRAKGHRLATESDTETLVHLYEDDGPSFVSRLDGMFAFGLWDARRRVLVLARDRFGKKPLYWARIGDELVFASEIQAFLAHPGFVARPDPAAIDSYLTFGVVTTEAAALESVRRVPAASTLVLADGQVRIERYWEPRYRPQSTIGFDDAVGEFRTRLEQAVRARLVSDVPVGAFLSGGLDSSSVVAMMARASSGPVRTFSVGFGERGYSELDFAREVARRYGTDHVEVEVDPTIADVLPRLVGHFGEPFADASALPTFLVSRVAGEHLKVVLSGDGGDELLGGYRRHQVAAQGERLHRSPLGFAGALLGRIDGRVADRSRLLRAARTIGRELPARYVGWRSVFNPEEKAALRGELLGGGEAPPERRLLALLGDRDLAPAERVMSADLEHYLIFDLLPKTDITAMAVSLEVRSPFLDRELVEFLARLPVTYRLDRGQSKRLLRTAMSDLLPSSILARGKHGFDVPVDHWLGGELRPLADDCLLGERAAKRGFVHRESVRALYERHRPGDVRSGQQLWTLLMLELWARAFLDGDYRPRAASELAPVEHIAVGASS
jgi:asparagine synthase (glutamine-hydrolysing)